MMRRVPYHKPHITAKSGGGRGKSSPSRSRSSGS
nr:MAG TPA: hypothetical protein [Caudoviricetes sp.]